RDRILVSDWSSDVCSSDLLTWVVVLCVSRYVSLASLAAAVALCVTRLGFAAQPFAGREAILTAFCLLAAGLIIVRHRSNLGRLRSEERRVGKVWTPRVAGA